MHFILLNVARRFIHEYAWYYISQGKKNLIKIRVITVNLWNVCLFM